MRSSAAERGEQLGQQRRARAEPILANFRVWLDEQSPRVIPKSPIAKAMHYTLHQWDALVRYSADGRLAIDNNTAERTLRGIAIGRRNWLFCGSERGGHTAAVHFSLIASAVRNLTDTTANPELLRLQCAQLDRHYPSTGTNLPRASGRARTGETTGAVPCSQPHR